VMPQATRSFKLWNKLRRVLAGESATASLEVQAECGSEGVKKRRKAGAPMWAQVVGVLFTCAVVACVVYQLYSSDSLANEFLASRRLRSSMCSVSDDDDEEGDCPSGASHPALVIVYLIGVFYIFIGIAIVCDEFFVPSLEQIGIFLNLSDDVCGATLMAAGGSAPELATSLIGTFSGSDVGFGTIVGSAVFNVLFVIACCVLSTPAELAPLELTGWPLARDCLYYALTLVMVAVCFGGTSPGIIEGWEAAFLFGLYLMYVVLMYFNDALYEHFNPPAAVHNKSVEMTETPIHETTPVLSDVNDSGEKKESTPNGEVVSFRVQVGEGANKEIVNAEVVVPHVKKPRRRSSVNGVGGVAAKNQSVNVCPSNVRAGFFHLICQESVTDTAGVAIVNKIKGDVRESFDALDKDKSGTIDIHELKGLLQMLAHNENDEISDEAVEPIMKALDLDGSGSLDFGEFTLWYVNSKQRLANEVKISWAKFDKDRMGMPLSSIEDFLGDMNLVFTEERFDDIMKELLALKFPENAKYNPEAGDVRITYDEFNEWYHKSEFFEAKTHEAAIAAESAGGIWTDIYDFPKASTRGNIIYIIMFPLSITLACTCGIRDVRIPGNEKWAYFEFFASIFWIGVYSFILVDWVTTIGLTLGIPIYVLGLTLLAGGTSVPDLLSSVVVAKAGKGDMAVSSSIGSNIFDVTVGLPVPWLLFNLVMDCPVVVGADNLVISIAILLCMVLFVIGAIVASGWAMDFKLGATMMILYVVFLAQDISRIYIKGNVSC
jgi:K+-dependent Na+/Ca+ exchanger-like protein